MTQAKAAIYGGFVEGGDAVATSQKIDLTKITQSRATDPANLLPQDVYISTLAAAFLLDRKAQNLTKKTLDFYRLNLQTYITWLDTQAVKSVTELTPDLLRGGCCHVRTRA